MFSKHFCSTCSVILVTPAEFSKAQVAFAQVLGGFTFQTIGEQTEDEKMISKFNSLTFRSLSVYVY